MAERRPPTRYLTFTLSSEGNCCPGFMHIQRCLDRLIRLAAIAGRTAILPPPWLLLHRDHNYSPLHAAVAIRSEVDWTRYLDVSELVAAGLVADPATHPRVHTPTDSGHGSQVEGGVLVPPDTPWSALREHNASLIALAFRPRWSSSHRRTTDCSSGAVGAMENSTVGLPSSAALGQIDIDRASPLVQQTARAISARLGPFAVLHIRRGRAVTSTSARSRIDGYSYGGCGTQNLLRVTSAPFIAAMWQRSGARNVTLLAMTNEPDNAYHRELRAAVPSLIFDWEVPHLS